MEPADFFPAQPKSAVSSELLDWTSDKSPQPSVSGNLIKQNKHNIRIYWPL